MFDSKDLGSPLLSVPLGGGSSVPITGHVSPSLLREFFPSMSLSVEEEPLLALEEVPPPPGKASLGLSPPLAESSLVDVPENSQAVPTEMIRSPHAAQDIATADLKELGANHPTPRRSRFKTVAQHSGHGKRGRSEENIGASKRFTSTGSFDSPHISSRESIGADAGANSEETPTNVFEEHVPAPIEFHGILTLEGRLLGIGASCR